MDQQKITINRTLTGAIALACLLGAAAVWLIQPQNELWQGALGALLRIGLLMTALWLALPTRNRPAAWANVSPWTFVGLVLVLIVVVRAPRFLLAVLPIVFAIIVLGSWLRPRGKERPPRTAQRERAVQSPDAPGK